MRTGSTPSTTGGSDRTQSLRDKGGQIVGAPIAWERPLDLRNFQFLLDDDALSIPHMRLHIGAPSIRASANCSAPNSIAAASNAYPSRGTSPRSTSTRE